MKTLNQTIAAMLTENTGTHMLDSGGASGRGWQRNAGKALADFESQPSATADIYVREYKGELVAEIMPCVNIFHLLTGGALELDDICKEFNAMPVDDWDGKFSGVSLAGYEWLMSNCGFDATGHGGASGGGFNTYNWASNHSQVIQGQELELNDDNYILIQIHGGADVRGGYTDAKLFRLDDHAEFHNVVTEDCGFSVELKDIDDKTPDMFTGRTHDNYLTMSWHGEWINNEGGYGGSDEELLAFATACGASLDNPSITIEGDAYLDF